MKRTTWLLRPMAVAVSSCFSLAPAWANPTGPQVVSGNVQFQGLGTQNLRVTNSPNAIINWQGFSIPAGSITQFSQQSAASAVLNRVVGAEISQIHGQLLSNGRVFLINPAGIVIGATGVINTAGFVGSTLNMLDGDFLAGKLKFQGDGSSGSILNQGWIKAGTGGNIVLVAPSIENSGVVETEGGQLVLAAGRKLTIGSLDLEGVQFEIQAPTDSVLNIGRLLADGGAVGVFAGTLKHSGDVRANALVRDAAGRVVLKAQGDVTLSAGSTISASGNTGGDILVQSASGQTRVAGAITAHGLAGRGGDVKLLGERVAVVEHGAVDASGTTGGGQIRVGGDYQGANASVQNASRTLIGANATLRADATDAGDGGRVIVWADKSTQYFGDLSARGGPRRGNGGFAEVSGKENLLFAGRSDLSAANGALGTLFLDPLDLFIADLGGAISSIIDEITDTIDNVVTISPAALAAQAGNVILHAGRYMRFVNDVNLVRPGQSLTATVAAWTPTDPRGTPPNRMELAANITTAGGGIALNAPSIQSFNNPTLSTIGSGAAGAPITIVTNDGINPTTPFVPVFDNNRTLLSLNAGTGAIDLTTGVATPNTTNDVVRLNTVTGGSLNITAPASINVGTFDNDPNTNAVTTTGPVTMNSTGNSITIFDAMATGGGVVNLTASGTDSSVSTRAVNAGAGQVDISARSLINTNGQPITTAGNVNLTVAGNTFGNASIFARVNNGGSVTASATNSRTFRSATVNIGSDTDLNAENVSATSTTCGNNPFSCDSATVNLTATGSVNVNTVTASALTSTNNNVNESVTITSGANAGAGIFALGSQVTAVDVTLLTDPASGGGIGTAALPLNVNAERVFTVRTNGESRINLNGPVPSRPDFSFGVAPAGMSYLATITRPAGGLTVNANATDTTVTIDNPTFVGFNQRVFNSDPSIALRAHNGALTIPTIVVPEGDTTVPSEGPPPVTTASLPVTLQGHTALTVNSYTRQSSPASLPKFTSFQATQNDPVNGLFGTVTLGTVNANRDTVTVSGPGGVTISAASLTTQGPVTVSSTVGAIDAGRINTSSSATISSTTGDITIGEIDAPGGVNVTSTTGSIRVSDIDTSGGLGGVALRVTCAESSVAGACGESPAVVAAVSDSAAFEVRTSNATEAGGITVAGRTIGAAGFANPLDLQGRAVTLTSRAEGGRIGFDAAALLADAPNLTIDAASQGIFNTTAGARFNVTTGATALQNLTVIANPNITAAGTSQVQSEARVYQFENNGASMDFDPAAVPGTQFLNGGLLSLTTTQGSINVTQNVNMGTGRLGLEAHAGNVTATNATFDGAGFTFGAGTRNTFGRGCCSIMTGTIGGTIRPENVTMTAGNFNFFPGVSGSVQTGGPVNARDVSITTFNGLMQIGGNGTDDIGSAGGGVVTLNAMSNGNGAAGQIQVGDIVGTSVNISSASSGNTIATETITAETGGIAISNLNNATTVGNLNAATSIGIVSRNNVTTGSLDAPTINIDREFILSPTPVIQVNGDIGAVTPVQNATLVGAPLTITGSVTGAADSTIQLLTNGPSTLTIGGPIIAGDNSFINLLSRQGFDFTRVDAGAGTSTVNIAAEGAPIRQTADGGANGIRANTISLFSGGAAGAITNTAAGDSRVDLFGMTNLTVNTAGAARFDAQGSTLSRLTVTKGSVATSPFELANLDATQNIELNSTGGGAATLRVNSPAATLDFTLVYNAGGAGSITLVNEGIVTNGGPATVITSGDFDGVTGGIRTGGPNGGGFVDVRGRNLSLGLIDTTPTAVLAPDVTPGQFISVSGSGNIVLNDVAAGHDITTGPSGAGVSIGTNVGAITRTGSASIRSDSPNSVTITTGNGDIGGNGTPLLITSPTVVLAARGNGTAYASLTGTNNLDVRGDEGFSVASDTAFNTLAVATKGNGAGPLMLTSTPGQTFTFARPTTDNFGSALANTFQVITADFGAAQQATDTSTLRAVAGHLFIGGGANLNVPNLVLGTSIDAVGDIKLQGTAATPLALNNANQTIQSNQDVLITGNVNLTAGAAQTISATRHVTVQAQDGSVVLNGPTQTISSTSNGTLSFLGGGGAGESVLVSASARQLIQTPEFATGSIVFQAGAGNNASVTAQFNGPVNADLAGSASEQQIQAGGQVRILGSTAAGSTDSLALVTSNQRQLVKATGTSVLAGESAIQLTAGAGTRATARISSTGNVLQQVAEGRCAPGFGCPRELYQTPSLGLQGGTGTDSFAEIIASGTQQIFPTFALTLAGGSASGTSARIENATANAQSIGTGSRDTTNNIVLQGGGGTDSFARIRAAGAQTVFGVSSTTLNAGAGGGADALILSTGATQQSIQPGNLALTGGTSATTTAIAQIQAAGSQSFTSLGTVTLTGGAGINSIANITTPGLQTFNSFSTVTLAGGTNTGAFAQIDTGGVQRFLNGFGNINLTAGGTQAAPVANAGAIILGHSQSITTCAGCTVTLTGGAGTAAGNSDALLRNLSGAQSVTAGNVTLAGGITRSVTGILNPAGAGTQTVTANAGTGNVRVGTNIASAADAPAHIQNLAGTLQTLTATGGLLLAADGAGTVGVTSAGAQNLQVLYADIVTNAGSTANAAVSAAANQFLRTTNGTTAPVASVRAAALGSGTASIDSGGNQLLEVDYIEYMTQGLARPGSITVGNVNGGGVSRIQSANQSIIGRTMTLQGGASAGSTAKATAPGTQAISLVDGGLSVLGGTGANASAGVDPTNQSIVVNGDAAVTGGSGAGAFASIISAVTQLFAATKGDVRVTGGSGSTANARVNATGSQTVIASDEVVVTGGSAAGTTALIDTTGPQSVSATNAMTLTGGSAADVLARINSSAAQTIGFGTLALTGGTAGGANARIDNTGGAQTLTGGNVTLTASAAGGLAQIDSTGAQTLTGGNVTLTGGSAANAGARVMTTAAQTINFGTLTLNTGNAAGANALVETTGTQTLTGGNLTLTANAAGALARIQGNQTINAAAIVLGGTAGSAVITSPATQTLGFTSLQLNTGVNDAAMTQIHAGGAQTLNANNGNITLNGTAGGGTALVDSDTSQVLTGANALMLAAGNAANATARFRSGGAQTLNFASFTGTAGNANGAFVKVDAAAAQSLTGGAGNIALTARGTEAAPLANASATIEGHSQSLTCNGAPCNLTVVGGAGTSLADGSRADAGLRNLSGAQSVSVGTISMTGGHQFSNSGIDNLGGGAQTVVATNGAVSMVSDPDAHADASVTLRNVAATAQTITAAGEMRLNSRGAGTVSATSGGSQTISAAALDVITGAGNAIQNGANSTVSAAADQTINTTGSLAAAAGVGMRVASLSTGTARVQSAGNQTLNIANNQLLVGRLAFGPPGPGNSASGNPAAGDSVVMATSETADPNQTVTAGSVYIQGPTGNFRMSKIGADGVQTLVPIATTLTLIGGSGTNAFAVIDPTNQTITTGGDILMQGGSGPNADALINATGPQSVTSLNGSITLIGGTGPGADALIVTTSPFQTVSAPNGVFLQQGPSTGGVADLEQGTNFSAIIAAAGASTSEILRGQDEQSELLDDELSDDAKIGSGIGGSQRSGKAQDQAQLCK
ncbi:MAG TPA: filamentous hemagglutinin N-terminal domain-containing protein [Burkholderiales bacterium]|nr:filamentous hemagglutinin N-terminal domain-containing protein [Burkholderiales bacterium]